MSSSSSERVAQKVLLVGWDAADWKVINPLLDAGHMPNLKKFAEHGVMGNIATLHPVLSPMLWTSIATGKRPFKHGIYGFYEPTPDGMSVQPITNLSRKTKALWNILNQNGMRSNVVGWWPSHPAEPIRGVMVSDMFHKNSIQHGLSKTLPAGAVFPPSMADLLAEFRVDIREVGQEELFHFVPNAHNIDQTKDSRLAACAKIFAECTTIHATATHLMETTEWDFMAVYYDAIDHFSHGFMKYHPPRRDFISEQDYENYHRVINTAYVYHDLMLGRLMELAGEDTVVILLSDHGFHPDHLRPRFVPMEPAGPAIEHRDLGIFAMHGPGIQQDKLVFGTNLLDIAPTVLSLFGLPIGQDMDGRVISEAFVELPNIEAIPSWDDVEGEDGCHPKEKQLDSFESEQALRQLEELGYIEEISGDVKEAKKRATRELNFNLARAFMDAFRFGDALPLLKQLYQENAEDFRIGLQMAMCYKSMNRIDDLEELIDELTNRRILTAEHARKKLAEFASLGRQRKSAKDTENEEDTKDEDVTQDVAESLLNPPEKESQTEDVASLFSRDEWKQIVKLRTLATISPYFLDFLKGYVLVSRGQFLDAIQHLERATQAEPNRPALFIQIGEAFLKSKNAIKAKEAFEKALALDENNPNVLLGLAQTNLLMKENELAAQFALDSISRMYHQPLAHYTLGLALVRTGRFQKASEAFQNAVQQNPNFPEAYRRLAFLYKNKLDDVKLAEDYFDLARQATEASQEQKRQRDILDLPEFDENTAVSGAEPTIKQDDSQLLPTLRTAPIRPVKPTDEMDHDSAIVVVTGLPRSGTSLMMQMLQAGGIEPLTDGKREADEDNPRGYLELEKIKNLARDNSWLAEAQGKTIKVIAQLLDSLPAGFDYKVVFMDRDIDEIIQSQNKMLERAQSDGGEIEDDRLKTVFQYQLEQAARLVRDKGVATIRVPYRSVIRDPRDVSTRVANFLAVDLDLEKMTACVDQNLYRNRSSDFDSQTETP